MSQQFWLRSFCSQTRFSKLATTLWPQSVARSRRQSNMSSHTLHSGVSRWEAISGAVHAPTEDTIHGQFIYAALGAPEGAIAVKGPPEAGGKTLTYADMLQGVFNVACALGPRQTDTYVGVLLPRDVAYPVCALGIMLSGSAYLPLSATLPEERVRFILEDSICTAVVTTGEYAAQLAWFQGTPGLPNWVEVDGFG